MHDHSASNAQQPIVYCRYCGAKSRYGVSRCPECGNSLKEEKPLTPIISNNCDTPEASLTCRYCHKQVAPFAQRCPHCGILNPTDGTGRRRLVGSLPGFIITLFALAVFGIIIYHIIRDLWP